ncbi:MAG: ferrous iron transport protein A [Bdellovibrionales bacterium]|nr:ferrous iron transport protein A [Bdellovibrionales bacterium]
MPNHKGPQACSLAVRLTELSLGEGGVLDRIELSPEEAKRLMRLGLSPGRRLSLLQAGDKCLIATAGARLALDSALAAKIYVVPQQEFV